MTREKMSWEDAVLFLRSQPDQQTIVQQCFYDDPIASAAARYHSSTEWDAVRRELPRLAGHVLDIGAGRGISSFAFAKEGWKVTALEPDTSDIVGSGAIMQLALQAGITIEVVNTWGESLPFPSNTFDLVYCRAVLHHAKDLTKLCSEISRVLKPGGILLATREHVVSNSAELATFLDTHPLHKFYGGEHAYLLKEYKTAIASSGLKLVKVLKPFESDINAFPESVDHFIFQIKSKLNVLPEWMPYSFLLRLYGFYRRIPGRLYSFVAVQQ